MMNTSKYEQYLQMKMVPAGAILNRIILQQKRSKSEIALQVHLVPQRINDLIHGNRRFTAKLSLALEKVLGIDLPGFFYLIQANHDIYLSLQAEVMCLAPDLNVLTKTTFWDVDIEKIDWTKCKSWAIRRVLEYGTPDEIREMDRFYGHDAMLAVLANKEGFRLYDHVMANFEAARI